MEMLRGIKSKRSTWINISIAAATIVAVCRLNMLRIQAANHMDNLTVNKVLKWEDIKSTTTMLDIKTTGKHR